jgi:DNA-binding Lrp family transcriptional regulator
MADLAKESVVFMRIKPGHVERAVTDLRRNPKVLAVEPVMGTYDLAISGAFRNVDELRKFQTELEETDVCEGCSTYPGFSTWNREGKVTDQPFAGWTLIRATDSDRAMKELQKIPSVDRLIGTAGEYNVLAHLHAKDMNELQTVVLRDIQKVSGVRRTETRSGLKAL